MSEQENIRILEEQIGAWNAHDADRWAATVDEAHVWESDTLPAPLHGREASRQGVEMYLKAFPDLHADIEQLIASGDTVVMRWRTTVT